VNNQNESSETNDQFTLEENETKCRVVGYIKSNKQLRVMLQTIPNNLPMVIAVEKPLDGSMAVVSRENGIEKITEIL